MGEQGAEGGHTPGTAEINGKLDQKANLHRSRRVRKVEQMAVVSVVSKDTEGGRQGEKTQDEGLFLGPKTMWQPGRQAGLGGAMFLVMAATCQVWRAPGAPACLPVRLAALGRGSHATKQHATCRDARTGWTFSTPPVDELFLQNLEQCIPGLLWGLHPPAHLLVT